MKQFVLKIKKGKHSPGIWQKMKLTWYLLNKTAINVRITIIPGEYTLADQADQADWNKLIGWSSFWPRIVKADKIKTHRSPWQLFGLALVPGQHVNSQRLVWRYYKGSVQFSDQYIYHKMQRSLPRADGIVNGYNSIGPWYMRKPKGIFNLVAYFGGTSKAPEDFDIIYDFID